MEIGERGIKLHGWQVVLLALVVLSGIGAMTVVSLNRQRVEVEKAQVVEQEKTERGHWLWGHWDDVAEKEKP